MPQFDTATYISQIFWLVICFTFLCLVMARYIVPRLVCIFEVRKRRMQEDWDQSREFDKASESLRQENLARLADARGKAHLLIHQTIQDIHHKKSAQIALLDEELLTKAKIIRHDLERQTQTILENMEPIVRQVVKETAPRILGQSPTQLETKEVVQNILKKRKQA